MNLLNRRPEADQQPRLSASKQAEQGTTVSVSEYKLTDAPQFGEPLASYSMTILLCADLGHFDERAAPF